MPRDEIEDAILAFVKKRAASPADIARCLVGSISARAFQDTGTFGALRRRNVSRDHVVNVIQRMIRQQRGITIDRHLGVIPTGPVAQPAHAARPPSAGHDDDDTSSAELSPGQARVLAAVSAGRSIFFTGPAGTGKSFLLRRAIESLRERHGAGAVFVTAATGIAACHIGGTTLHSFAGVGIAKHGAEAAAAAAVRSGNAVQRWRACRCLVVDEVSMVDAQLFEAVELTARRARRSNAPFGGVQLVLTGDFLQLPPVGLDEDDSAGGFGTRRGGRPAPASAGAGAGAGRGRGRGGKQAAPAPPAVKYCFESPRWAACVSESAMLQTVFRQRDQRFVDLLNSLRAGRAGDAERRLLASAGAEVAAAEARGEDPTRLFARNRDVDALNARKLASLPGEAVELEAVDGGEHPWLGTLQRNCAAPTSLRLKLGARVMLLKNVDVEAGLVNGATGRIVDFVRQPGAGEGAPADLPRVEFALRNSDGETHTVTRTVERSSWSSELGGVPVAWREQVPLKLAWALSIHKAQGMTLPLVDVSLAGVFARGQAYVALSRGVALSRIRVRGFSAGAVKASPRVLRFYAALQAAAAAREGAGGHAGPAAAAGATTGAGSGRTAGSAAAGTAARAASAAAGPTTAPRACTASSSGGPAAGEARGVASVAELADEDEALMLALEAGAAEAAPAPAAAPRQVSAVASRPFKRPRPLPAASTAPADETLFSLEDDSDGLEDFAPPRAKRLAPAEPPSAGSPAARRAAPGGAAASDAGGSAIDREVAALLAGLDANDLE